MQLSADHGRRTFQMDDLGADEDFVVRKAHRPTVGTRSDSQWCTRTSQEGKGGEQRGNNDEPIDDRP